MMNVSAKPNLKLILVLVVLFIVLGVMYLYINLKSNSLEIKAVYSDGRVEIEVIPENQNDILKTQYKCITEYLPMYNPSAFFPKEKVLSYDGYRNEAVFLIDETDLLAQQDYLNIEVTVFYHDGKYESNNLRIHGIKKELYDDFVITPVFEGERVIYQVEGLQVSIALEDYNEEVIFYSNPHYRPEEVENETYTPNIQLGFSRDYAIYSIRKYIVADRSTKLFEDVVKPVSENRKIGVDKNLVVLEIPSIDVLWLGLYPYDFDGNEIEMKSANFASKTYKNPGYWEQLHALKLSSLPDLQFLILD